MATFDSVFIEKRASRNNFFTQINKIIDWSKIEKELLKVSKRSICDSAGRPAYSPLVLFKIMLVQTWYGLSDTKVEDMVYENLAVMRFVGIELSESVPDHSTISRFRSELVEKKCIDRILNKINKQFEEHNLIVKNCVSVDASIVDSPFKPKGKIEYIIAEDRKEDIREYEDLKKEDLKHKLIKKESPGVDSEGRWLSKGGKHRYGFKKQFGVDENGIILGVHTTTANEHDSKGLEPLLDNIIDDNYKNQDFKDKKNKKIDILTDKGYYSPDNYKYLKDNNLKNRISKKAFKNRPLSIWDKKFNQLIGRKRYVVERTFGSIKCWFRGGVARYKGLAKVHFQNVLEGVCYNLKRSIGLIVLYSQN